MARKKRPEERGGLTPAELAAIRERAEAIEEQRKREEKARAAKKAKKEALRRLKKIEKLAEKRKRQGDR